MNYLLSTVGRLNIESGASIVPPYCTIWYNTFAIRCYIAVERNVFQGKMLLSKV